MNFVQAVTTYFAANLIIGVAFTLIATMTLAMNFCGKPLIRQIELKLHYFIVAMIIGICCLQPFLPKRDIFAPIAKVWVSDTGKSFIRGHTNDGTSSYIAVWASSPRLIVNGAGKIAIVLATLLLLAGGLRLAYDLKRLLKIRSRSYLVRKIGQLHIHVSEEIRVPFSFWLPWQKNIVMPESLLGTPEYRIAMLHEIHHHRQGDTKWVYLIWGLRLVFIFNPIIHFWNRWIAEIQEFACDEALIGRRKVESLAYASCLVQVAESAFKHERQPICATGLTFLVDRKTLKRRITTMLDHKKKRIGWRAALPIGAAILSVLGATAYASKNLIQDRRVTMAQAREMAAVAKGSDDFPVVVNDRVLKWLNYYIGTPDGRDQMRNALARMETYRPLVQEKLDQYQVPVELIAIPITESGYKNQPQGTTAEHGAGLWMFIKSTARRYGMQVDDQTDERLVPKIETDAAMRYLLDNKNLFDDWRLSVLAYNAGEQIRAVIDQIGSKDPWGLIDSGLLSQETTEYLPKIMAAILIMRNSSSIQ